MLHSWPDLPDGVAVVCVGLMLRPLMVLGPVEVCVLPLARLYFREGVICPFAQPELQLPTRRCRLLRDNDQTHTWICRYWQFQQNAHLPSSLPTPRSHSESPSLLQSLFRSSSNP